MISKTGIQRIAILMLAGMLCLWVGYETKAYLRPDVQLYTVVLCGLCAFFLSLIFVIDRKYNHLKSASFADEKKEQL